MANLFIKKLKLSSMKQANFKMFNKNGVSPVIATVLLIAMVIAIGLIIFLWFRSLTKDAVTKFGGKNIELVCEEIDFTPGYSAETGILTIQNFGNVPVYGMNIKISGDGSHTTEDINVLSDNWPTMGLKQGDVFSSINLSSNFTDANSVLLIPVLLGSSKKGQQTHVCDERFGKEVLV